MLAWLAVVILLAAGCGVEPEAPLRIGTVLWPSTELLFLAQDRGWLSPTEFRLVEFVDDGEAIRAFRNHAVAAAWLSLDEVLAVTATGLVDPVILFVSDESRGGDAVVAQPDLITAADLKDRRVAAQINTVNAFLLDRALKSADLQASDVQLVNLPPYRQLSAFLKREVDAVVTYEPVRSQIVQAGGVEIFSSASTPFEVLRVLAIRRDYLETHLAQADALCTAWHAAFGAIQSSRESRAWVAARLNTTPDALDSMFERVRLVDLPESRQWLGPPRPQLLPTVARLQGELLAAGLMTVETPFDGLFSWPPASAQSPCRG